MASPITQSIYDSMLKRSTRRLSDRLKARVMSVLFEKIKKGNPLVEAYVGQFKLQIPFSHQLPFILQSIPLYSANLARIGKYVYEKYTDLTCIDIGANVGDSVALLRNEATYPILCIEGDEYFFSVLQKNASMFSDVYLVKNYVGESSGEVNAVSVELGGTAHLGFNAGVGNTVHLKKLSTILEENPMFQTSKMLKIDTDGFDNKILRGSIDFLKNARPVIFFEYDPFFLSQQNDDGLSVFATLASIGYQNLLIYENNGELLLSVQLDDNRLLEDITHFYTGRKGIRYCDICAFHEEDNDLFNKTRKAEISFFEQLRS